MMEAPTLLMENQALTVQAVSENSIKLAAVGKQLGLVRKVIKVLVKVLAGGMASGGYFEVVIDDTAALGGTPTVLLTTQTFTAAQLYAGKLIQIEIPQGKLWESSDDTDAYLGLRWTPVSEAATGLTVNAYVDEGPESEVVDS